MFVIARHPNENGKGQIVPNTEHAPRTATVPQNDAYKPSFCARVSSKSSPTAFVHACYYSAIVDLSHATVEERRAISEKPVSTLIDNVTAVLVSGDSSENEHELVLDSLSGEAIDMCASMGACERSVAEDEEDEDAVAGSGGGSAASSVRVLIPLGLCFEGLCPLAVCVRDGFWDDVRVKIAIKPRWSSAVRQGGELYVKKTLTTASDSAPNASTAAYAVPMATTADHQEHSGTVVVLRMLRKRSCVPRNVVNDSDKRVSIKTDIDLRGIMGANAFPSSTETTAIRSASSIKECAVPFDIAVALKGSAYITTASLRLGEQREKVFKLPGVLAKRRTEKQSFDGETVTTYLFPIAADVARYLAKNANEDASSVNIVLELKLSVASREMCTLYAMTRDKCEIVLKDTATTNVVASPERAVDPLWNDVLGRALRLQGAQEAQGTGKKPENEDDLAALMMLAALRSPCSGGEDRRRHHAVGVPSSCPSPARASSLAPDALKTFEADDEIDLTDIMDGRESEASSCGFGSSSHDNAQTVLAMFLMFAIVFLVILFAVDTFLPMLLSWLESRITGSSVMFCYCGNGSSAGLPSPGDLI